jgi:hypothetical protein
MQVPRLSKVTLNMGVGEAVGNKKILENAVADMAKIAGQKPIITLSKKSIATFTDDHHGDGRLALWCAAAAGEQEALIASVNEEGARLSAEAKAAVADATSRHEAATRDRAAIASSLPADLVALYDALAARGNGAGLLQRRTCGGCRMVLSGTDLNVVRAAAEDDVVTCPECGCILVRGEDSGL